MRFYYPHNLFLSLPYMKDQFMNTDSSVIAGSLYLPWMRTTQTSGNLYSPQTTAHHIRANPRRQKLERKHHLLSGRCLGKISDENIGSFLSYLNYQTHIYLPSNIHCLAKTHYTHDLPWAPNIPLPSINNWYKP